MQYQIRDASPFKYFAMIPNMVDDLGLSPHAYRLYGHLKRVAGEDGRCFQNTKQLSETCQMSAGMITKAKKELIESVPPLISIALTNHPVEGKFSYHEITILNIWPENIQKYGSLYEQPVHNMNSGRSQYERHGSQYEPKNNPIKKTIKKNDPLTPDGVRPPTPYVLNSEKMERCFSEARGCPLPDWEHDPKGSNKRWRVPLNKILKACEGNVDAACYFIAEITREFRKDNLTFTAPDQILESVTSRIIDRKARQVIYAEEH